MSKSFKPTPWKVHSSEYLIEDKWLCVRADVCETSSGATLNPFYVFEYTDWTNIAAFNNSGEILLAKQYRHGLGQVGYELPGGVVDKGEPPLEAARRELLEETGHCCESLEVLLEISPNPATHNNKIHCVFGTGCEFKQAPNLDDVEQIEAEFVSIPRLLQMIEDGSFTQVMHISSVFLALKRLGRLEVS